MSQKEHWENVYQANSAQEVSWYQEKATVSLSIVQALKLRKESRIIDVGGGASTFVDGLLLARFEDICVLDLSSHALDIAKRRLGGCATKVCWLVEDITLLEPKKRYDFWHDRAVFHFLTQNKDRAKYKEVLNSSVRLGGYVMIAAFSIGGPEQCSGLNIVQYDVDAIKKELGVEFQLMDERIERHVTPSGKEQLFRYFVFQKI